MKTEWKKSPLAGELVEQATDGFTVSRIPFTEEDVLARLNAYERQVRGLLDDIARHEIEEWREHSGFADSERQGMEAQAEDEE